MIFVYSTSWDWFVRPASSIILNISDKDGALSTNIIIVLIAEEIKFDNMILLAVCKAPKTRRLS